MRSIIGVVAFALLVSVFAPVAGVSAEGARSPAQLDPAEAFDRTWSRTDLAVSQGVTSRTWMWGPQANTTIGQESYAEGAGGLRTVVYYDKSRMEITNPDGDSSSPWYVTNGLLALELMTGAMQYGNDSFQQYAPAEVNVAGDADDSYGPTYASLSGVMDEAPRATGEVITEWIGRSGSIYNEGDLATYGVTASYFEPVTNHTVASVFWDFMNSSGLVWENGQYVQSALFESPFYATGYPVTEPYWASVTVGGTLRDVLIQAFERRVLTYTPGNPAGFEVEAGNVGQHYYHWRYEVVPNGGSGGGTPVEGDVLASYDLSQLGEAENVDGGYWGYPTSDGYAIDLYPESNGLFWLDDQPFGDASYSIDVRVTHGLQEGDACLDMRVGLDETSSLISDYIFCLRYESDDTGNTNTVTGIYLDYWDAGGYESMASWDVGAGIDAGDWHNLKMIALGTQFWLYFDGQFLGSVEHGGSSSGYVGFSAYDYSDFDLDIATMEFRDLVVRAVQ